MASGINNTFRQVGIATGIAGLGAIFQHEVTHSTTAALTSGPGREVLRAAHGKLNTALVSGEVGQVARALPPAARDALMHAYRVGFTHALASILIIAAGVALAGSACAFALVRSSDFVASGDAPAEPAAAPAAAG
jgi:hypothetical protein